MRATVYVRLKQEVLDPQGDAVKRALVALGFGGVKGVRVGKLIEIELDPPEGSSDAGGEGEGARDLGDLGDLRARIKKMADEMLANTVIEDYEVVLSGPEPR